jgi:hypothetical protein
MTNKSTILAAAFAAFMSIGAAGAALAQQDGRGGSGGAGGSSGDGATISLGSASAYVPPSSNYPQRERPSDHGRGCPTPTEGRQGQRAIIGSCGPY